MKPDLRTALRSRVIVGDGAMGTYLHQLGVPVGISHEELNVTNPDIIGDVHRQYIDAGAEAVETNTYSAQRWKLEKYGLGGKAEGINAAGAAVARKAAGSRAWVLGAVGPFRTGPGRTAPGANVRRRDYEEQLGALLGAGVDGLILETFYDLEELSLVLRLARKRSDLPVICQFAVEDPARTPDGVPLAEAFRRLIGEGADVVGLNCRGGPSAMIRAFAELPRLGVPFSVFPNAGLPDYVDGRVVFSAPPEYFGETARTFADLGVRLIGGCCGTTPAHIAAVAAALKEYAPEAGLADTGPDAERADTPADVSADAALREKRQDAKPTEAKSVPVVTVRIPTAVVEDAAGASARDGAQAAAEPAGRGPDGREPSGREPTLVELVRRRHTVIVELDPPRDLDLTRFMAGAAALKDARADALTMADNSLAVSRMSNMAAGMLVKERIGIRPLVHIACRDRNLIGTQSHMLGLHALGIDHVLAVTGDPARFGDLPGASSVYDMTSFDIIRMIKQLNEGISFSGKPLRQRARFVVGAAFNPNVKYLDKAIRRLEKKVEAGADFIMTQPVYDPKLIERLAGEIRHIPVPVFIGIMPLASGRNAEFLHNEVPGIQLSDRVRERMHGLEGEEGRREGLAIARELLDAAMECFNGIYLITPFMLYDMTAELTRYVRRKTATGTPARGEANA